MTRRLVPLWLLLAATGGLLATGRLEAAPSGAPEIGTARVAYNDTIESAEYANGVDLVASYSVVDDQLTGASPVDPTHDELWSTVTDTVPEPWRTRIRQFSVVQQGAAGTVAMVHQSGIDPDRWLLSVDIADADNGRLLVDTLVHELVHLVTLRPEEFTFEHRLSGDCDGVTVAVGCAHPGSVVARWADAFWTDPSQSTPFDPESFVAPYAATGPHEDLAETFLYWTRGDRPEAGSVLAAKFAFIDTEPDLATLATG
ncbi:MAG: hypothetical protein ACR2QE_15890 [Acidimicrobiales bacterium]